jgi:hypothetical protein
MEAAVQKFTPDGFSIQTVEHVLLELYSRVIKIDSTGSDIGKLLRPVQSCQRNRGY